jgi:hypothetical protein
MRNHSQGTSRLLAAALVAALLVLACQKKKPAVPEPAATRAVPRLCWNAEDELARFISGMPVDSTGALAPLTRGAVWKKFAAASDSNWSAFRKHLGRIHDWAGSELKGLVTDGNVFYPFSGPDFAFAHALFPDAARYTFFGLEPVGNIPDIPHVPTDSLGSIFGAVNRDLDDVMNLTFFKTKNMRTELADRTVQGTLPLLMVFIARTGNHVTAVRPFAVDTSGTIAYCDTFVAVPGKRIFNRGVEIRFQKNDTSRVQTLVFFSADVSNGGLQGNRNARKLLEKLSAGQATYIKAASYLMHQRYFSMIRDIILSKSGFVLEDDSGIPYRYFEPSKWTVTLYGGYTKPYELFKEYADEDLKKAYDAKTAKPLRVRFGYQAQPNLQLAVKKQ